jgi:hypothetical protein
VVGGDLGIAGHGISRLGGCPARSRQRAAGFASSDIVPRPVASEGETGMSRH